MARRVFFSFHYDNDIWRANQVRNANVVAGSDIAGFFDHSEYEEAKKAGPELARFFRRHGVECLVEFKDRGMKAHFGRASKLEAAWVLIVGDDELRKGRFGLKDMITGRQVDGTRDELLAAVRAH